MNRIAVVLLNLGGPDSLEAVEPFLINLFSDPDIFKLPFQKAFARFIAKRRSPGVRANYESIGGKSPIGYWTEKQRAMLETELRTTHPETDVFVAMRYWHPSTEEVLACMAHKDYDHVLLLPLYPQYSFATTKSSFKEWDKHYRGAPERILRVEEYYEHPGYIAALNERIDQGLARFPEEVRGEVQLLFSAHSIPVSYVKKGDPYPEHIKGTIKAVMDARGNDMPYHECFQSKVGPVKWLSPSTEETVHKFGEQGLHHLLLAPISFVSDHIETLCELDIEYREVAENAGVKNYMVIEGLNDSARFIQALADVARGKLG